MNSNNYLNALNQLPYKAEPFSQSNFFKKNNELKKEGVAIEVGIATEVTLLYAFNELNVDDVLFEAYEGQYPVMSSTKSMYEKGLEAMESGDSSVQGLLSGVKGKVFEHHLVGKLESQYPGWDFEIAASATQPGWDIKGIGPEGEELFVQAKMGGASYAGSVKEQMLENPDVLFATSTEIQEKILEESPELASQFIEAGVSNEVFTEEVSANLEQLIKNKGIDIPDNIGELLPYIGEIVLGIKLLIEMSKANKDFKDLEISEKRRIQGLKAILTLSRFSISMILITYSASMGTLVLPGIGTISGIYGGYKLSNYVNKHVKPYLNKWAMILLNLDKDEMVYYNNKQSIDALGENFQQQHLKLN